MPRSTTSSEMVIRQQLRTLERALPGAQKGDVHLLHQARVTTRRLREALPLVMPGPRGRKLERTVQRLTRALGPVRELDVALLTLDELNAAGDAPGIGPLKQIIRHERERLHADMCREIKSVDLEKLRRRVATAARKGHLVTSDGGRRDPKRLAKLTARASRRAARLRAAIESAAGIYLPDRLHEVRIAVKKLRYALELTCELSRARATARLRALKEAQDLLGRMHDLEILIARVRAVQGSAKAPNLRASANLDRLVRRLETECRQIHGHYMTRRRKLLAMCDQIESTAAPERRGRTAA